MDKITKNILSWCKDLDENTLAQAKNIANHPCLIGNVCLMPDAHLGMGMPIGGVVAFKNAVSPNMVGVDIGCGMLAVKTSLTTISTDSLKSILSSIRQNIPLGMKHHQTPQAHPLFDREEWQQTTICAQEWQSAQNQLGTLGGGNHFIEIQSGDDGHIWIMIHSGSRNLGYKVAKHYDALAQDLCKQWFHNQVVDDKLAFLPKGTTEFDDYLREMNLCLEFAYANRQAMLHHIKNAFLEVEPQVEFQSEINIHHNYVALENHYNQNVWVHRKGATLANTNTIGIIPGSQGTSSYIVQGKGSRASLHSCSHGAGRVLSRTQAIAQLDFEEEKALLDKQGILHGLRNRNDLEEAARAYKDIDMVMENQKDLVEILVKLRPLAVVKG